MPSYFGNNGPLVVAVMWMETIMALIFVLARLHTRHRRMLNSIGWDDHLISITMLLFFGYTIGCAVAAVNGFGSHLTDLGLTQGVIAIKWEIAAQTFNIAAIGTSKSSISVFLLRIITNKFHFWLLWFCIFSTAFVCASCIEFVFTQCTPLESIFNPSLPHTCHLNFTVDAIFSGSYTAGRDFALDIFPWFLLWKLDMKRKERLTIAMGLSLGVFAGICGIIRAVELQGVFGKSDYTYLTLPLILWGSTELTICILCASIPILRPLYKQMRGIHSSSDRTYELGNTPSHQLESGRTKEGVDSDTYTKGSQLTRSRSQGDDLAKRNPVTMLGRGAGFEATQTMVYIGGADGAGRGSDEEILKGMQGRLEGEMGSGMYGDNLKSIHKTTRVDVTYQ